MKKGLLHLIGCATGIAGADIHSGEGPLLIQASKYISYLEQQNLITWDAMITLANVPAGRKDERVQAICTELAKHVAASLKKRQRTTVIGGDHSCAIGTWSGVYDAYHHDGDIGLIWFDAHMDGHTPETTPSGNIHGMPVATLLGYGYPTLTNILHDTAKIKPENLCLIGTRSFESGEAALLKKLNVKIYDMEEIAKHGFKEVLQDAIHHVSRHTIGYGFSLDLDGLDPEDAPGGGR